VSLNEIQEFISKLNAMDPEYVYRLPTEAEWEFATRAETQTIYPFGDDYRELQNYAWYSRNSIARTHNVASLKPNGFGLYDMLGNVSQWVQDWWVERPESNVIDPIGPTTGIYRTIRGGSWGEQAGNVRSSMRSTQKDYYLSSFTGFRLVRSRR
jgi:formylglycine-generating enzyme required for sulfatase activity